MKVAVGQAKVMFIALEYGGHWRVNLRPDADTDLVMVIQTVGEDPLIFARRLVGKVVSALGRGFEVVSAVLSVSPTLSAHHLEARCAIAKTLLRAFRGGSSCELYLVEPSNSTLDCRQHLIALAEGLAENAAIDCRIRVGYESFRASSVGTLRTGT